MIAPYPWFGGKRRVTDLVWSAFGDGIKNYVEPFFGSGAVLLARPDWTPGTRWVETINDRDGFVATFWRALQADPEGVARYADYPVSEDDLLARHVWLVERREVVTWALENPEWYDAKVAGWWVWGLCCWIGSGWCSGAGPWVRDGDRIVDRRKLPHLGDAGQGVNRQLPHLGDAGQGVNRQGTGVREYLTELADRMRYVRVCSGDWSRVVGPSVTHKHGVTAVFLDPPYSTEAGRTEGLYPVDCLRVAHDVRAWCIENGTNPLLRIVLCGYEGEHALPGWVKIAGRAGGGTGYGGQGEGVGRANSKRERLWLSPHCVNPELAALSAWLTQSA